MQEEFLIQNSIIAAIKTTMLDLGTRVMLHHIDLRFLDAKMSDITITCKLSLISSLVHVENTVKYFTEHQDPNIQYLNRKFEGLLSVLSVQCYV